jgi:hypothetical protein
VTSNPKESAVPDDYDIDSLRLTRSYVRLVCDGEDVTALRAIIGATGDEQHLISDRTIRGCLSSPLPSLTIGCPRAMMPQITACVVACRMIAIGSVWRSPSTAKRYWLRANQIRRADRDDRRRALARRANLATDGSGSVS